MYSSVYSYHLYLISSTSVVFTISVLYHAHPYMKCFFHISSFQEEMASLSHSIVLLSFFALLNEKGPLISPCYSLELGIHLSMSFPLSLASLFCSFRSLSHVRLCDPMDCSTPGFHIHYQLLELLKLMSIESVMPSNHLILYCPLILLP